MFIAIILVAIMLGIDQLTKYLAVQYLEPIGSFGVIPGVFHLTYVENSGAAFGIMQNQRLFFLITTVAVVIIMAGVLMKFRKNGKWFVMSLLFLIGGGLGNFIDRFRIHYVVDFFELRIIHFAVFNMADVFVCCGAIMLFIYILFGDRFVKKGATRIDYKNTRA